jgi:hypothetical protein
MMAIEQQRNAEEREKVLSTISVDLISSREKSGILIVKLADHNSDSRRKSEVVHMNPFLYDCFASQESLDTLEQFFKTGSEEQNTLKEMLETLAPFTLENG